MASYRGGQFGRVTSAPGPELEATGWTNITPVGLSMGGENFGFSGHPKTDPSNPAIIYAPCDREGLFRSIDYGVTWAKRNADGDIIEDGKNWFLEIATNGDIYIGDSGNFNVVKSTNGGVNFTEPGASGFEAYGCDTDPADPLHVIWTSHSNGEGLIYESEDGGATIARTIDSGSGALSGYAYFGLTAETILYVSDGDADGGIGTVRTTWNGSAWSAVTQVSDGRHFHGSHDMWVDRVNDLIVSPGPGGVRLSDDDGVTWDLVSATLSASAIATPTLLYTGRSYALNGMEPPNPADLQTAPYLPGTTFTAMDTPSGMGIGPRAWCHTVNAAGQHVLICCCWVAGLWRYVEP